MSKTCVLSSENLEQQNERLKETIKRILLDNDYKNIQFPDVINGKTSEVIGFYISVNGIYIFHVYTNTNILKQIFGITCRDSCNKTIMNINRTDKDYSKSTLEYRPTEQHKLNQPDYYDRYKDVKTLEQYILAQINIR